MLATDGMATYVLFLYRDILVTGFKTTIGFNAGDGLQFFNLPQASDVFSLVDHSNIGIPGTFIFRVDQNQAPQAGKPSVPETHASYTCTVQQNHGQCMIPTINYYT